MKLFHRRRQPSFAVFKAMHRLLWLVALLFLVLFYSSDGRAQPYRFDRLWPTIQQPWYFSEPNALAIDREGHVFVADFNSRAVKKFTGDGHLVTEWPETYPGSVAIDPDGVLYVAGEGMPYVSKYTGNGEWIGDVELPERGGCSALAVGLDGELYVADDYRHRVYRFPKDGEMAEWGGQDDAEVRFEAPRGVAVDEDGFVYVTDQRTHRVLKFTAEGVLLKAWGSEGKGDDQFNQPAGVAVHDGVVYVVDMLNDRVQRFTRDGAFLSNWGRIGSGGGQLYAPTGIAIDPKGYVYVADRSNDRVQKFTLDGRPLSDWSSLGDGPGEFFVPRGIDIDGDGVVYVADANNHRVQAFTSEGGWVGSWGEKGAEPGQLNTPYGVAAGGDGRLWVADTLNDRIQIFDSAGGVEIIDGAETEAGPFDDPAGMATDSDGHVYVADWENHRILKFDRNGRFIPPEWGDAGETPLHRPLDVAVGNQYVYAADTDNDRIVRFGKDGIFIDAWGGDGELSWPTGIAVDEDGDVYVADSGHHRILKFTPEGDLAAAFGGFGSLPGQLKNPADVAVSPDGRVFVTDMGNNRIQVFRETDSDEGVSKALIVAGGGPFPGNHLWDATRMCANFAYRVLTYQGFTRETIRYLSEDAAVDLDNNPEMVEVSGPPTVEALENGLTAWASDADRLVLYMVDHGGEGTFRLSGRTTLSATALDDWLDRLQEAAGCEMVVIYDACESGGFLPQLTPPAGRDRIVAGSTSPGESAYFVTLGSVSFSNFFWTAVFRGLSVGEAFASARDAISETTGFQHPVLDDTGDGVADDGDGGYAATVHIGNGTAYAEDAPVIGAVSPEQNLFGTNSGAIYAEGVSDPDGVARVWAIIRPPGYRPGASDNTVRALPSVDLLPAENDAHRYEIVYDRFDIAGVYEVAVHARDAEGNTSPPHRTRVRVDDPLRRRAVIVAGGPADAARWPTVEKNAGLCHEALRFQGYAAEDIYFMSPVSFSDGVDAAPTREGLAHALTEWAATDTRDLALYLVGAGAGEGFRLNATETVSAAEVRRWLDALGNHVPGDAAVICDIEGIGDFASRLAASGGSDRIVVWRPDGAPGAGESAVSFSQYLWGRIANGDDLYSAFVFAKNATGYAGSAALRLDDDGNGLGNEPSDGRTARRFVVGAGVRLAGNAPVMGEAPADRILQGDATAEIRAADVTTTGAIVRVWAVIEPPADSPLSAAEPPTVELTPSAEGYAGIWVGFSIYGTYRVTIYAEDAAGNASPPISMRYAQTVGPDAHEPDGDAGTAGIAVLGTSASWDLFPGVQPARRNFHQEGDADWLRFYAVAEQSYEIRADNPGARCDTVITLYDRDGRTVIAERDDWRDGVDGRGELLSWRCPADGLYFLRVSPHDPTIFGPETGYDLSVYIPVQGIPGLLVGRVTDGAGAGVGDARVKVDAGEAKASALSDPSGHFVMALPSGVHAATIHAPGFEPHVFPDVVVQSESTARRDVVLTSPHRAAGADAGPDRIALEGATITLDGAGSENPGGDASFAWTQIDGPPAILTSAGSPIAGAVLPEVPEAGDALTFRLTLVDPNGETAVDEATVRVFDKSVFDKPDGALRFETAAGRKLEVRVEGGALVEIAPLPATAVDDTVNRPWNMVYGLVRLKTSVAEGNARARFFFPEPAVYGDRRYGGYQYDAEAGWREMAGARLSDDAIRMDVPLGDGTASGDVDADARVIGFGISYEADESDGSGGGGGGCFIRSVGMGGMP